MTVSIAGAVKRARKKIKNTSEETDSEEVKREIRELKNIAEWDQFLTSRLKGP